MGIQTTRASDWDNHASKQGSFHGLQYTATVRHVVKTQFSVYEFPTTIVFTNASKSRVQKLIDKHLLGEKTIRSTYGNPYKCSFGRLTVTERDGEVTVRGRGVAVRDRSERAEEEVRKAAERAMLTALHFRRGPRRERASRTRSPTCRAGECSDRILQPADVQDAAMSLTRESTLSSDRATRREEAGTTPNALPLRPQRKTPPKRQQRKPNAIDCVLLSSEHTTMKMANATVVSWGAISCTVAGCNDGTERKKKKKVSAVHSSCCLLVVGATVQHGGRCVGPRSSVVRLVGWSSPKNGRPVRTLIF